MEEESICENEGKSWEEVEGIGIFIIGDDLG